MHKFIPLAAIATACAATPISAQQAPPQLRGKQHKLRLYSAEEIDETGERTEKKWWGEISCCERYCCDITRYFSANVAADLLQIQNLDQLDEYKQDLNQAVTDTRSCVKVLGWISVASMTSSLCGLTHFLRQPDFSPAGMLRVIACFSSTYVSGCLWVGYRKARDAVAKSSELVNSDTVLGGVRSRQQWEWQEENEWLFISLIVCGALALIGALAGAIRGNRGVTRKFVPKKDMFVVDTEAFNGQVAEGTQYYSPLLYNQDGVNGTAPTLGAGDGLSDFESDLESEDSQDATTN